MASAGVKEKEMEISYAKPDNEGLGPGSGIHVKSSKGIHDLIFEKLQENPDPESGIQQATKLLASMNEHLFRIIKRIQERQYEERQGYYQLERLARKERYLRSCWRHDGKQLASLKRDLDKLTFANNAYKDKAIMAEDNINIHNMYFLLHHGANSIAEEKKLLKEMNGRHMQKKRDDCVDSGLSSVQYINDRINKLRWDIRSKKYYMYNFRPIHIRNIDEDQVRREITELKWARDKAFANAPVHGNTWNSLPSKNVIKQQIKFMEQAACDEDRKKHLQLKAEIGQLKQEINAAKKDISSLNRQLLEIRRKKGDAYKVILKLVKIQNQNQAMP